MFQRDWPVDISRQAMGYLYKLIESYDKQVALLFDGRSRSKSTIQLMMLRQEGLVDKSGIQGLSEGLKEYTNPKNDA